MDLLHEEEEQRKLINVGAKGGGPQALRGSNSSESSKEIAKSTSSSYRFINSGGWAARFGTVSRLLSEWTAVHDWMAKYTELNHGDQNAAQVLAFGRKLAGAGTSFRMIDLYDIIRTPTVPAHDEVKETAKDLIV